MCDTCGICYNDDGVMEAALKCNHSFHLKCMMKWWATEHDTQGKSSCPMCRREPSEDEIQFLRCKRMAQQFLCRLKSEESFARYIQIIKSHIEEHPYPAMSELVDAPVFVCTG